MPENPYQPPKEENGPRPAPSQQTWGLAGLLVGMATGPILAAVLIVGTHEYHDPPLAQQFARVWPALSAYMAGMAGMVGILLGVLARRLLFWRRL